MVIHGAESHVMTSCKSAFTLHHVESIWNNEYSIRHQASKQARAEHLDSVPLTWKHDCCVYLENDGKQWRRGWIFTWLSFCFTLLLVLSSVVLGRDQSQSQIKQTLTCVFTLRYFLFFVHGCKNIQKGVVYCLEGIHRKGLRDCIPSVIKRVWIFSYLEAM